ncbi:MAG TPA: response regulator [Xanthobacteraceae bacterium]|jgi:CheY-like chemotaxis protein|nr:response regulator [Xanthobacteraceae bacterium]
MTRILLIDDDEAVRRATAIMLEARGFEVVTVDGGQRGIETIKAAPFDVVIVDLFMPDMDGLATTRAIRELSPHTPIIAVSGFMFHGRCPSMPDFHPMAAEAGAIAALYKPLRANELVQAIEDAMRAAERCS